MSVTEWGGETSRTVASGMAYGQSMDYFREEVAFSVDNATETESESESEEGEEDSLRVLEEELIFLWVHFPKFRGVECKRFLADTPVFKRRELMEDALGVLASLKTLAMIGRLQQSAKSMSGLNMPLAWQVFLHWAT